ncbi:MAG: threonine synthase [Pseudomonadales bacterium]|nr:threonine synthase [Pseudomonadales bacterium]
MKYQSTRGGVTGISFRETVLMGLADDGGLLVPESVPDVSAELSSWQGKSYSELALEIMSRFITDIPRDDLADLINRSYSTFTHEQVTPLVKVGDDYILELFHGPTLAFKDVALQFLGNVFEYILQDSGAAVNILGATSGDTGSAAIAGVRGKENINIFIMFPEGKTSPLQELQMTSVLDDNVHNIAVNGSFDDCQSLMKTIFSDLDFKSAYQLAAVNSVNWTRVLAQVVYYFSAWYQLRCPVSFDVAVPTGNFGNIFAGYIARQMGLPIRRLILATNANDILCRFFTSGKYERGDVHFTHSPAMDIQVSSNFERYLYYKLDGSAEKVRHFMQQFADTGRAELPFNTENFDDVFLAGAASNEETLATIRSYYDNEGYLPDPHTAVGLAVMKRFRDSEVPLVCLSTAHPAKFEDAIQEALPGVHATHPTLEALRDLPTRKVVVDPTVENIKSEISTRL